MLVAICSLIHVSAEADVFIVTLSTEGWRRSFLVPCLNTISRVLPKLVTEAGLNQQSLFLICFPNQIYPNL